MKRIMITILAVSALQADIFAAGRNPKRTADIANLKEDLTAAAKALKDANGERAAVESKRCTRSNAAEIAAQIAVLRLRIEALEDRANSLREQISEATDADQVKLNNELALNAVDLAEAQGKLAILKLGDVNGDRASEVTYDIDGALVTNAPAYTELEITRIEIRKINSMLTSAREQEAVLSAKLSPQSSVGSWVFSAVTNFWFGTSTALATTQETIRELQTSQARYSSLLPVLKAAACQPRVATLHSDDLV